MLAPESFEFPFALCDGVVARFDQQLVATAGAGGCGRRADVKSQAVKACAEVTNVGFLVRQAHATRPEPGAQEVLGFDGFFVCGAEDHEVSGVPHERVNPTAHPLGGLRNPQGLFHTVEGDV